MHIQRVLSGANEIKQLRDTTSCSSSTASQKPCEIINMVARTVRVLSPSFLPHFWEVLEAPTTRGTSSLERLPCGGSGLRKHSSKSAALLMGGRAGREGEMR